MIIGFIIGVFYNFIFSKIGKWIAKKISLGIISRLFLSAIIFILVFGLHLLARLFLTDVEAGGEASFAAFMASGGFFYAARKKPTEQK